MVAAARKVVLTKRGIDALKPAPAGKRILVWDAAQPHLAVRVTDKGHRTFIVVKRRAGDPHPVTHVIGPYPATTLAKARELAPGVLTALAEGHLPSEIEADRRRVDQRRRQETFGSAVDQFIKEELTGLRSRRETEAILRREFLGQTWKRVEKVTDKGRTERVTVWSDGPEPAWRDTPISKIARRDVIERLDAIKRRAGKHAARHALGAVRKFFSWCADGERFGIEASPCAGIRDKTIGVKGRDLKRHRVLTDDELRDVWQAADKLGPNDSVVPGYPFGPLVRLLMLTGQRLNDIASARWSEISLDAATLTVPAERYKTGTAQEVPLPPAAIEILKTLPKFGRGYVFTTTSGKRPISGMTKMKARLEKSIIDQRAEEGAEPMAPWVLHDLRRTVRTRLVSDIGVDAFIAERVIGHALPGLHGVYDQGTHRDQKRAALDKWALALAQIVGPKPEPEGAGVVPVEEVERRRRERA